MRPSNFGRHSGICVAVAMLAACGGHTDGGAVPAINASVNAFSNHHTFKYTGAEQTFHVPSNVTQIRVIALGGNGAYGSGGGSYVA
ncbi:MAG: hypothetical protein WCD03_04940, partial [Candidatus Cybelea sp.]